MRATVERGALDCISLLGQVSHDQIAALHRHCDNYVSLNPMGNLTNAKLEAMRCGACMIIPASQPETGIDLDTDAYILEDAALRFGAVEDVASLRAAILRLHRDPKQRAEQGQRAATLARKLLPTWNQRVAQELTILEKIAAQRMAAGLEAEQDA